MALMAQGSSQLLISASSEDWDLELQRLLQTTEQLSSL